MPQPKNVEVVAAGPDRLDVRGALTFETARSAYETGLRFIRNGTNGAADGAARGAPLQIDCGGVSESDSAGLAVLIEWLSAANRLNRRVRFLNLPEGIRATAEISDVEALLASGT